MNRFWAGLGAFNALIAVAAGAFGAITPIGGLGFLAGWAVLAWSCFRS